MRPAECLGDRQPLFSTRSAALRWAVAGRVIAPGNARTGSDPGTRRIYRIKPVWRPAFASTSKREIEIGCGSGCGETQVRSRVASIGTAGKADRDRPASPLPGTAESFRA